MCGIVGIHAEKNASKLAYNALFALQHRGQEAAGIADIHNEIKGFGLVSNVFNNDSLENIGGNRVVGHVRYSTRGDNDIKNIQPLKARIMTYVHNGEVQNGGNSLESDSLQIGKLWDSFYPNTRTFTDNVIDVCKALKGSFAIIFNSTHKLYAARDAQGNRPLVIGKLKDGGYIFASETCALDIIEAEYVREVFPGEIVSTDGEKITSVCRLPKADYKKCIFEKVYLSNPQSVVEEKSIYKYRHAMGRQLYRKASLGSQLADIVVGVPDSGIAPAIGYSEISNIPLAQALIKHRYVGRTFIQPDQESRIAALDLKLSVISDTVKDCSVVVIDDSIVRGNTSRKIVEALFNAGAFEVHFKVISPQIKYTCDYGVDIDNTSELISHGKSVEDVCKIIGATSLQFLTLDDITEGNPGYCTACFTGDYF